MLALLPIVGALLFLAGVVYSARAAIRRGRMSDPRPDPEDTAARSLEPRRRGLGFLGLAANWPGFVMMAAGAVMLLVLAV